jgi:hypothetical protein
MAWPVLADCSTLGTLSDRDPPRADRHCYEPTVETLVPGMRVGGGVPEQLPAVLVHEETTPVSSSNAVSAVNTVADPRATCAVSPRRAARDQSAAVRQAEPAALVLALCWAEELFPVVPVSE